MARRCEWEPALQSFTGCEAVNCRTLASFRVEYRTELDELFRQVLGLLKRRRADPAGAGGAGRDQDQGARRPTTAFKEQRGLKKILEQDGGGGSGDGRTGAEAKREPRLQRTQAAGPTGTATAAGAGLGGVAKTP